jgi:hypothetical protein
MIGNLSIVVISGQLERVLYVPFSSFQKPVKVVKWSKRLLDSVIPLKFPRPWKISNGINELLRSKSKRGLGRAYSARESR